MIEIKIQFPDYEAAITALAAIRAVGTSTKVEAPKDVAPSTKPKKDAETKPSAAPAQTAASETKPTESKSPGTSSGATRESMSAAIRDAAKTHRDIVLGVLTKYGATSAKGVGDDKIDAFMADLETALKPADDLGG